MKKKIANGFTLVELLVVIGIIALLVSILLPSLNKARLAAKQTQCLSSIRQMMLYNVMYANENKGWFIPVHPQYGPLATDKLTWAQTGSTRKALGLEPFEPVISGGVIKSATYAKWICPLSYAMIAPDQFAISGKQLYSPDFSYGFNAEPFWKTTYPDIYLASATTPNVAAYRASRVKSSSRKMIFADALNPTMRSIRSDGYTTEYYGPGSLTFMMAYRHNKGVNVAFFDGHAEWAARKVYDQTGKTAGEIESLWDPYSNK